MSGVILSLLQADAASHFDAQQEVSARTFAWEGCGVFLAVLGCVAPFLLGVYGCVFSAQVWHGGPHARRAFPVRMCAED